nr:MAG TPA: Tail tape measure [Siphoviridae sp. ct2ef27]
MQAGGGDNVATLTQYLSLRDGVSGPLKKMTRAAETLQRQQERTAFASQRVEAALSGIGREALRTTPGLSRLGVIGTSVFSRLQSAGNNAMRTIQNLKNTISKTLGGTVGQFALGNIVGDVVLRGIDSAKTKLAELIHMSDQFSGIQARLNLVTGSQEQAAALNEEIYRSALRARGAYATMADSVSKIGLTAKEAFPDPKEIVPFVENIQKLFAIGGTDTVSRQNAMIQLTQSLGSGRLQGDELRSIAEAAPMIEQVIADYMGVSVGAIKQLGSEGAITAEIIKNAMLKATDDINKKFEQIPLKWEDIWTNIGTRTTWAFRPVYDQLREIANSKAVQMMANGVVAGATAIAAVLSGVIYVLRAVGSAVYDVGAYISSWLIAALQIGASAFEVLATVGIGALAGLATATAIYGAYLVITNIQTIIFAAQQLIAAGASAVLSGALRNLAVKSGITAARMALLAAVTWLLANPMLAILALIGIVIAAFVAWQVHTQGLRNTIAAAFRSIAEFVANAVNFMIENINRLISVINNAASAINSVFKTDIAMVGTIDYRADPSAWGAAAEGFVQNFSLGSLMPDIPGMDDIGASGGFSGAAAIPGMGDIAGNTKDTADNTKAMKDAMDIMDEDLKFFRDIAEQEAINRYTTASIDIKVENQNNIASDVDADGMIVHLIDQLGAAMDAGAEAVHT